MEPRLGRSLPDPPDAGQADPSMEPYSEVWEAVSLSVERNRYYEILAFGTKQEQRK